ncbi:MAG: hypothetical protein KAT47_02495 [Candidatus Aegiribacteria sp.]|nr:hypothetical protein [Candidatus Aegiribacteria sp.]
MGINIISMIMLVIPPAITSESSWTSPDIRIATEWSLNVMDLIDPAYTHLGTVYEVESEEGFEWHTVLVDKNFVLLLEGDTVVNSIPYSGDIYIMTFSPDYRYLLGSCYNDEKLILFDLEEGMVKSIHLFSSGMGFPGNPRIRVTNDGTVLVKHSTYLRMYDSDFNCILSRDNFSWGVEFVGLSEAGDRFYTTTYDSLRAYYMQGNLLWNTELPEPHEFWGFRTREFELSNTGSFIAVSDFHKLHIISTDDGSQIAQFDLEESISDPVFSESDSIIAIDCMTHPPTTPLSQINSFGVRTVSLQNESYELNSQFQATSSLSEPGMPNSFSSYTVSDNGSLLGFLYYSPTFGRVTLLSRDMEIVWLSENLKQDGSWRFYFPSSKGLCSDDSGFWYFDGTSIHSCLIEEVY